MEKNISKDFELYLENVPGLMVIDEKGNLIYINRQCADYIQVDQQKSIGKYITEVFPPSNMQNLLKGEKTINTDFYFCDGRMSISIQVQLRDEGKVVGVLEYDMLQDLDSLEDILSKYTRLLNDEMNYYREQFRNLRRTKYSITNLVGSSKVMQDLRRQIQLAAATNSTVIITGETGTGKELVAHSIHNLSSRIFGGFIKINASSFPESLAESEFFGYEEGAFTGAKKGGKKGKFELAHNGTLFIDEINQMPISFQPKILRVLQEHEVDRIGADASVPIDVRIIAATNQDLYELVKKGLFREDLFYRLNVIPVVVPPLRNRLEDLPELVMDKIEQLNLEMGKNVTAVEDGVYDFLKSHDWPGNVRELYNGVEKAMNFATGEVLTAEDFGMDADLRAASFDFRRISRVDKPVEFIRDEAERNLLRETIQMFDGNKTKAAAYLKISRPLLYQKMKRLEI